MVTVPFADLYHKTLTDLATQTNSYDAFVFDPQWMGDYVPPGYLEDITDRVKGDQTLKWDDVAPFFRDFSASYKGRTYTIPLDGDFQMVYYRTDILKKDGLKPPKSPGTSTWRSREQYHGKDLNGDGKARLRVVHRQEAVGPVLLDGLVGRWLLPADRRAPARARSSTSTAWSRWSTTRRSRPPWTSTRRPPSSRPPDELNLDVGDTRGLFTSGRCALSADWGDIGTLAIDPKTSTVQDKVGAVIMPGSKRVLDRATGKLVDCDATTCPHAIDGVNHAPFSAFGGWSGAINAAADKRSRTPPTTSSPT